MLSQATQLVEYPHGNGIEVVFAGGRREFMHKNQSDPEYPEKKGDRQDNKDLIKQWLEKYPDSQYVWNKTAFDKIDANKVNRVLGTSSESFFSRHALLVVSLVLSTSDDQKKKRHQNTL